MKDRKLLTTAKLNQIRGKVLVMKATKEELLAVFSHLDEIEDWLDESDADDVHGTEGWRHAIGLEER